MAAPSSTTWGTALTNGSRGGIRLGLYITTSNTNTTTNVTCQVWIWTMYGTSDSNNRFYFNWSNSATTSRGSVSVSTSISSGAGWSTNNQKLLKTYTTSYSRSTSSQTKYAAAKLSGIEVAPGTASVSKSFSVPALASYTIKYDANNGSGAPASQTKYYGQTLKLSSAVPTRSGYNFVGWSTDSDSTTAQYQPGGSYTANSSTTLYAIWSVAVIYTITYNNNGGENGPGTGSKPQDDTYIISSVIPDREGYNFLGWGLSSETSTVSYHPGDMYTANSNLTLYAIWSAITYTIYYIGNGGTNVPDKITKTYGVPITLSDIVPTRQGYKFLGWGIDDDSLDDLYQPSSAFDINADTALYAIWEIVDLNTYITDTRKLNCVSIQEDDSGYGISQDGYVYVNTISEIANKSTIDSNLDASFDEIIER